jgi:predicted transcriptional regulator of viral defense system
MTSHSDQVLTLAQKHSILRSRDLSAEGIPRTVLTRMLANGQLARIGRGLYTLPDRPISKHTTLSEVASRCPQGVVCLLSALRLHELTTQSPYEVWLAIPNNARTPRIDYPPLRVVRFSGPALSEGIEERKIDGVNVRYTNVPKTIADCFKYRNKIGLDVALEALNEAWNSKRFQMDELWHYARICRVSNVIRPYLESLI